MFCLPSRTVRLLSFAALFAASPELSLMGQSVPRVQAIRFWSFGDVTRIAIQTEGEYRLSRDQVENPARALFDFAGLRPPSSARRGLETIEVNDRRVKAIRVAPLNGAATRIVFDLEGPADIIYSQLVNPDRLMIEIRPKTTPVPPGLLLTRSTSGSHKLGDVAMAETTPPPQNSVTPPLAHLPTPQPITSDAPTSPIVTKQLPVVATKQLPVDAPQPTPVTIPRTVPPPTIKTPPPAPLKYDGVVAPAAPAKEGSSGDRSLVRVFGLKMAKVVIDAGHGGHDTGSIGPGGMLEKDLVLDVALRLGGLITKQLGAEVIYTRSDDVFIPLEQRTRIANDQKADLFISIHANSSNEPRATGVETYYFNFTSDKAGLDLATRENAMSSSSISDLNDLLHRAVMRTKLEESREFAQTVQTSLWGMSVKMNSLSKNRGVRQAPFMVLIGATMPSILAEIGFVSNAHDEKLMHRSDQRQKIADALFKGVAAYANSLSHVQMARATGK
jgi:N-acetylmuramoyl-L-alanine amidase